MAVLFLGLLFSIVIILFVIISCLLIYSLLMISVETKRFESGVQRLVGLSKTGTMNLILLQAVMFVVPSIILAFICVIPVLMAMYSSIFTEEMGF